MTVNIRQFQHTNNAHKSILNRDEQTKKRPNKFNRLHNYSEKPSTCATRSLTARIVPFWARLKRLKLSKRAKTRLWCDISTCISSLWQQMRWNINAPWSVLHVDLVFIALKPVFRSFDSIRAYELAVQAQANLLRRFVFFRTKNSFLEK